MDWTAILIAVLSGAGGAGVVKLIDVYSSRGKTKAETGVLRSEASENIVEAAQVATNVLNQALTFKQAESKEYQARVEALEKSQAESKQLISELQSHRDARTKQIDELTEANEALLAQVAALRSQIALDTAATRQLREEVESLRGKYDALKQYTLDVLKAVKEGKEPPPPPADLSDSISGWKLPK